MSTMTDPTPTAPAEHHDEGHDHSVPLKVLVGVWGALMFLTWITVVAAGFDAGNLNILIALAIALVKSSFVALYFMHLRYDRPFNAVILISALAFVALFIGLALLDTREYQPDLIPGYAPEIEAPSSTESH
jgi:cytochrome c oxidase subunit 4